MLLFGDSGTGKSTSIKAIVNQYYEMCIRDRSSAALNSAASLTIVTPMLEPPQHGFTTVSYTHLDVYKRQAELEHDYSDEKVARYTAMEEAFKDDGGYYYEKE